MSLSALLSTVYIHTQTRTHTQAYDAVIASCDALFPISELLAGPTKHLPRLPHPIGANISDTCPCQCLLLLSCVFSTAYVKGSVPFLPGEGRGLTPSPTKRPADRR